MKPTVVMTEHLDDDAADWLAGQTHLVRSPLDDADRLDAALGEAEGLVVRTYTQVNAELLERAPNLRVVGRAGVGLDNFDLAACRQRGVRVVYTPDANTQAVVEYLFALILDAVRPRLYFREPIPAEQFHAHRKTHVGRQLSSMTLGILGMGRIGRRVAQVAEAIGMTVLCNDLLSREQLDLPADAPGRFVDQPTLYREADVLTIHVDGRADNHHLIDADVLDQLKPGCILMNAARGMLVDASALAAWADGVRDAGGQAYLDVHDPEPPDAGYPLYGRSNVHLLPHLASRTPEALSAMSWVVRDVVAVLNGELPRYPAA